MSNRNFSYIFSPYILWGNVSSQSETGLCNLNHRQRYHIWMASFTNIMALFFQWGFIYFSYYQFIILEYFQCCLYEMLSCNKTIIISREFNSSLLHFIVNPKGPVSLLLSPKSITSYTTMKTRFEFLFFCRI